MTGPGRPTSALVPAGFVPPDRLDHPDFHLRPLGPEHNASDCVAWTSSMAHIHATPGWADEDWPHPMSLDENLADLARHRADYDQRSGFTYTVLATREGSETVIGCVYIYRANSTEPGRPDAVVRSWVRAADASLDAVLAATVRGWIGRVWPFERVEYASRESY